MLGREKIVFLFVSGVLFGASASASAESAANVARQHDDRARALFQAGEYAEALSYLHEAQAALPADTRLFNMGRCHEELGQDVEAIELYRQYLASDRADAGRRQEALDRMDALRSAAEEGGAPPEEEPPPQEPEGRQGLRRAPFFATLGVTGALAVGWITLAALTASTHSEYQRLADGDPRLAELQAQGEDRALVADVFLGLTAASALAAVVLAVLTDWGRREASSAAPRLTPSGFLTVF